MDGVLTDVAIVVAVAVLIGFYVSWRATRVDRLHARAEAARANLDAALARRSAVALELAGSGLLDPATSLLIAGAAHDARAAGGLGSVVAEGGEAQPRELAESDLSRALRAAFNQPGFRESLAARAGADELLAEIEAAGHQVYLARKFYNDAVAATLAARRRRLVRLLRLAGGAQAPMFFEIDDAPPEAGDGTDGAGMPRLTG
ncbi:MAG TPA: hypothetical protein VLW50_33580 [Streptosporangiaceae bacterium]|nr:hypothetical protein [Streptosporangiaceae bacterium]